MVKHPWPLLEISLSEIRRLATLNINTYLSFGLLLLMKVYYMIFRKVIKCPRH